VNEDVEEVWMIGIEVELVLEIALPFFIEDSDKEADADIDCDDNDTVEEWQL
jgi:hypothetical protein